MATVATADSSSSPLGFVAASGYKFSEKDQRPVRLKLKKRPKAVEEELQRGTSKATHQSSSAQLISPLLQTKTPPRYYQKTKPKTKTIKQGFKLG
ncbi:hypothetical protein KEM55_006773 [Ascosphaera atra]|nr:hypothetical protein KEM55_006773 [Ascosphaera atra]